MESGVTTAEGVVVAAGLGADPAPPRPRPLPRWPPEQPPLAGGPGFTAAMVAGGCEEETEGSTEATTPCC